MIDRAKLLNTPHFVLILEVLILCLIAAGSVIEICFWDLCCLFGRVGHRDRGCRGCLIVGEVSQSIGFVYISFTFEI